jgi:hypothetical protein
VRAALRAEPSAALFMCHSRRVVALRVTAPVGQEPMPGRRSTSGPIWHPDRDERACLDLRPAALELHLG